MSSKLKKLFWVGSSKKDLISFSDDIQDTVGHALGMVQQGKEYEDSTPLQGFGGRGVIEIKAYDAGGTYRAVYTITMPEIVFVLHVFQKKSKTGIKTPKKDLDLIKQRLKEAKEIYKKMKP